MKLIEKEETVRNNLINLRLQLGFTQTEFAKLFNKDRQYQFNIENGKRKGSAEYWLAIQKKFNLANEATLKLMEVSSNETT